MDGIVDKSFLETSPFLTKTVFAATALAVAFGPIASTINLKDLKAFGKAINDGLELDHGMSFNTPDGKPPHIPRWVYLIPGGMVLWEFYLLVMKPLNVLRQLRF